MPTRRYERREPTHDWQQIRPLLKDPAQLTYEIIRPVILWGIAPKERAAETGMPRSTIYYRANLFDQAGMASLLPAEPPVPERKKPDRRTLPPPMRQAIVDVYAAYPPLSLREIATICYARFGRRPSPRTIKLVLADGPKPSINARHTRYADIPEPVQRRKAIQYARQLHELTGKPYPTIWEDLKSAFRVAKYANIPELDWPRVVKWFQAQLEQKRKR